MSDHIATLIQEVKLLLDLPKITYVCIVLEATTIAAVFHQTLVPILTTNKVCDIPDFNNDIVNLFNEQRVNGLERTVTDMSISATQRWSFESLIMMAYVVHFIDNNVMDCHQMVYTAWLILKLAVALFRYRAGGERRLCRLGGINVPG